VDTSTESDATPDGTGGVDHVDHLLDQWARERPDLDTSVLKVAARIVRLSRYLDRHATERLTSSGLHEGEMNVLAALRRAGEPHVLTPTELYRSLLVSSGAMTNRLDRLETAGLLARTPDPDDRRKVQVGLTAAGREVIDATMDAHVAGLAALFDHLTATDADAVADQLRRLLLPLEERDLDA
jgi:DNA-binding MarR family transcriptional regulator